MGKIAVSHPKNFRNEHNNVFPVAGKPNFNLLPKDLIIFFSGVSKDDFFSPRSCTAETTIGKEDPTLFVSYYPGLLNEKIL